MLKALSNYVNIVDGSPGCSVKYEERISQQFDPTVKVNYAYMAGHYRVLLEDALSLIPSAYLDELKGL